MKRPRITCPGCGGTMAKGSRLCRTCRGDAVGIGVQVVEKRLQPVFTGGAGRVVGTSSTNFPGASGLRATAPITPAQQRAWHGKLGDLSKALHIPKAQLRDSMLRHASKRFGRKIKSSSDLNEGEANWALDELERQLEELGADEGGDA